MAIRTKGDDQNITLTSLEDVTGLAVAVEDGDSIVFTFGFPYTLQDARPGWMTLAGPAGTYRVVAWGAVGNTPLPAPDSNFDFQVRNVSATGNLIPLQYYSASARSGLVVVRGALRASAAGTLKLQARKGSAGGHPLVALAGGWVESNVATT